MNKPIFIELIDELKFLLGEVENRENVDGQMEERIILYPSDIFRIRELVIKADKVKQGDL